MGYKTTLLVDPNDASLTSSIRALESQIRSTPDGSPVVFYYAGHGLEIGGKNFLFPSDANVKAPDIVGEAVPVDFILQHLSVRHATQVVILDACRDAPIGGADLNRGLAYMPTSEGTFIAFSTAPGMSALDGDGKYSPFAGAFITELGRSDEPIESVFRNIRRAVLQATGGEQTPWDSSSLLQPFYL